MNIKVLLYLLTFSVALVRMSRMAPLLALAISIGLLGYYYMQYLRADVAQRIYLKSLYSIFLAHDEDTWPSDLYCDVDKAIDVDDMGEIVANIDKIRGRSNGRFYIHTFTTWAFKGDKNWESQNALCANRIKQILYREALVIIQQMLTTDAENDYLRELAERCGRHLAVHAPQGQVLDLPSEVIDADRLQVRKNRLAVMVAFIAMDEIESGKGLDCMYRHAKSKEPNLLELEALKKAIVQLGDPCRWRP